MSRAAADDAFARGNYRLARSLYSAVAADSAASDDDRTHARARLSALGVDKLALWLGVGTMVLIVVAYFLARWA